MLTLESTPTAVILAAGMGTRLRSVHAERPKGFVEVGAEAIIARSLALLKHAGIPRIVLVAGWREEVYREFLASRFPEVGLLTNPAFAETGSLASLLIGAAELTGDLLVVESDLLYETRALTKLLRAPRPDTLLASGLTESGDEVWVYGQNEQLAYLSKQSWEGAPRMGELVGLTRLSAPSVTALRRAACDLPTTAHYEDGLNAICQTQPIQVLRVDDLIWCEIDSAEHLARARDRVWPRIQIADQPPASISP